MSLKDGKYQETLCWTCQNACGGCSWSKKFKKVKGWTATQTWVQGEKRLLKSYLVTACPKYVKEVKSYKFVSDGTVAKWLGLSYTTYRKIFNKEQRVMYKLKYYNAVVFKGGAV